MVLQDLTVTIYQTELEKYQLLFQKESKASNILSGSRLMLIVFALVAGYQFFKNGGYAFGAILMLSIIVFLVLVRRHDKVKQKRRFYQQLVKINEAEIAATNGDFSSFGTGAQYVDPQHAYSYDLDIFGDNSIFQYLNRTTTVIGADRLAQYFLGHQSDAEIMESQEAIRDLAGQLPWRQEFQATGQLHPDQKSSCELLVQWCGLPLQRTALVLRVLWQVLTFATIATGLAFIITQSKAVWDTFFVLTSVNLIVVIAHAKKIKHELQYLNAIFKVVEQYGFLLRYMEQGKFSSPKLMALQQKLHNNGQPASATIIKLSGLLHQLESVQNLIGAVVFNSLFLYHVHILLALEKWKGNHAAQLKIWVDSIAEVEALSSFGHFSYNNPSFVFPTISDKIELTCTKLGHPLIAEEKRVCNDIQFEKSGFVILTGSNMSGKSTFLRSLGINLLLAKVGAPVCATACTTFNFEIFVSMKLSDSLHDNESYFYAELKRLQRTIEQLETGRPGFVLLDEILRGTNSNDKLAGTIGLLETMVRIKSTGVLATHDLNVCDLQAKHPETLRNMCFEVEMTHDDLYFDYQLRDGVCVNKSASFLMKKMGVIG